MTSSCGQDTGPDCTEVLAEVYRLLDKECPQEHEAELRKHLDECPPCLEQYGIGEQLKQLLARKCGNEHAPDGLRDRLRETIRATVAERAGTDIGDVSAGTREGDR